MTKTKVAPFYLGHGVYTVVGTEYQTYVFGFCLLLIIDTVVFFTHGI